MWEKTGQTPFKNHFKKTTSKVFLETFIRQSKFRISKLELNKLRNMVGSDEMRDFDRFPSN